MAPPPPQAPRPGPTNFAFSLLTSSLVCIVQVSTFGSPNCTYGKTQFAQRARNRTVLKLATEPSGAKGKAGLLFLLTLALAANWRGGFAATLSILRYKTSQTQNCSPPPCPSLYAIYVTIAAFCYDTRTCRRAPRDAHSLETSNWRPPLRWAPAHAVARGRHQRGSAVSSQRPLGHRAVTVRWLAPWRGR